MEIVPLHQYHGGEYPKDSNCFIIGKNGMFHQLDNDYYMVRNKADELPQLEKVDLSVHLKVPALPYCLFQAIEGFFAAVYEKRKSETVVILACDRVGNWGFLIPEQTVSAASAKYDLEKGQVLGMYDDGTALKTVAFKWVDRYSVAPFDKMELFGSIHSHAGMGAFHSGTDDHDEFKFDGLHITMGNFDRVNHTYACRWMLAGSEYKTEIAECIAFPKVLKPDDVWLGQIKDEPAVVKASGTSQHGQIGKSYTIHGTGKGYGKSNEYNARNFPNATIDPQHRKARQQDSSRLDRILAKPLHQMSEAELLISSTIDDFPELEVRLSNDEVLDHVLQDPTLLDNMRELLILRRTKK